MSDEWIFFPCQIGEHTASIFFDHGIRDRMDSAAPKQLLKVRANFKQPRSDGMPGNEEFQSLKALEDGLQAAVQQFESIYVGRITTDGHRQFYIYTSEPGDSWASALKTLGAAHGYPLSSALKPDEKHAGYWQELFPTEEDWQVIQDLRVIDALGQEGDDGSAPRSIDHWAFFLSPPSADNFCQWAREKGYTFVKKDLAEDGRFRVSFSHDGTVRLADITSHTIVLRRKISEMGGEYDGWETVVCRVED